MAFVHLATPYTLAVTRRQFIVWRKLIWSSLAINIANPYIPATTSVKMLSFPMTRDKKVTFEAWAENSPMLFLCL